MANPHVPDFLSVTVATSFATLRNLIQILQNRIDHIGTALFARGRTVKWTPLSRQ